VISRDKSARSALYDNNGNIEYAFCYDSRSPIYKVSPSGASADPFTSKTNKFAQSKIIRLVASADINFKLGDSDITDADAADHFLPQDTPIFIGIDKDEPYLRVFGTADVYVTEFDTSGS